MRLPPALAARATQQVLELLGEPPGRVLELGFAGIHATPLRLAGFEVVVVEPDPAHREHARQRAGAALDAAPAERFDVVVAPEDAAENRLSVECGFRLLSSYELMTGERLWVLTGADRSATTLLLPTEY